MPYFLAFLEGIITFISPCLLPMLPIYLSFLGGNSGVEDERKILKNAFGFVLGFSLIFILLGAFAGTLGQLITLNPLLFNLITGGLVVVFGLGFLGFFNLKFINLGSTIDFTPKGLGFFKSMIFGMIFSIGWTPCVGAFLGTALLMAANSGSSLSGILMLFLYALGLGIPFMLSALAISKLTTTFDFIKRNYSTINKVSGAFLILIGILMMTGRMGYLLRILSF